MSTQETKILKTRYNYLKKVYNIMKKDLKKYPYESVEYNEIMDELTDLSIELQNVKNSLNDQSFRRKYIDQLLVRLFFGEQKEERGR